eukprot:scaffold5135_cov113-Isochrysis_galbana.AAC.4
MRALATTATAPSGEMTVGEARPKAAKLPISPAIRPSSATQKRRLPCVTRCGSSDSTCVCTHFWSAREKAMRRLPVTASRMPRCKGVATPAHKSALGTQSVGHIGRLAGRPTVGPWPFFYRGVQTATFRPTSPTPNTNTGGAPVITGASPAPYEGCTSSEGTRKKHGSTVGLLFGVG